MRIIGEKRDGDIRLTQKGGVTVIEETYNIIVEADSPTQTRLDIVGWSGLPQVGSVISSGFTVVKSKNARRRGENSIIWDVTLNASSEVQENEGVNFQGSSETSWNPESWVPVRETMMERIEEISLVDYNEVPIAASTGQPFDTGIVRARYIPVWEFAQFEPITVTDEIIVDRNELINSVTFIGKPAETLLLTVVSSVVGFFYGQRRRLTVYRLKYNSRNWKHKRLDVGTYYISGSDKVPFTDSEGNVTLGSLDGAAGAQAIGDPPEVLEFSQYATDPFTFLRI